MRQRGTLRFLGITQQATRRADGQRYALLVAPRYPPDLAPAIVAVGGRLHPRVQRKRRAPAAIGQMPGERLQMQLLVSRVQSFAPTAQLIDTLDLERCRPGPVHGYRRNHQHARH